MSTPDYCASYVEPYIRAGARIVGGCCGTTPEHIRAMRRALDKYIESSPVKLGSPSSGVPAKMHRSRRQPRSQLVLQLDQQ